MQAVAALLIAMNLLPNPSFEEGVDSPTGWTASAEGAAWVTEAHTGEHAVAVTGDGTDSVYWRTEEGADIDIAPGGLYEFSTWVRLAEGSGGTAITGPSYANRDIRPGEEWSRTAHVFRAPDIVEDGYVRIGQWHADGTIIYDDAGVVPVSPVPVQRGDLTLGEGEMIADGRYTHTGPRGGYTGNYSRCLVYNTAHFNSYRWVFFPGAEVVYRHELGGIAMTDATVEVNVGWHAGGECVVEAGTDGETWTELGRIGEVATQSFDVPEAMLPSDAVYLRLRSLGEGERAEDSAPGSFQVHSFKFTAGLAENIENLRGATTFLIQEAGDQRLAVEVETLGGLMPGADTTARLVLRNPGDAAMDVTAALLTAAEGEEGQRFAETATVPAGGETTVSIPYTAGHVGDYDARISVAGPGDDVLYAARFQFSVPELYRSDYGYAISSDDAMDLWWAEGTYKINRTRPAPTDEDATVRLSAARGEFEPVQVVLRPKQALSGVTASISDLSGDGGTIPASSVDILRVGYVFVHTPTDQQGAVGWWPDPLPPLDESVDLEAGQNQPLWLRVEVPRDAAPGDYDGTLALQAEGWSAEVPVQLHVWDFEMPAQRSVLATMGFSSGNLRRYHHLETEEQMAEVFDAYMQSFRDHRIDPYGPWLQGPRTELAGVTWNGGEITAAEDAPEGNNVLHIVDQEPTANPSASLVAPIPIDPTKRYELSFMARAAEDHIFQTTLACNDADGNWMSGNNIDTRHLGTGEWEEYTVPILPTRIAEGCHAFVLSLRPTNWIEGGEPTGEVWFDDVKLTAEGSDENLIPDGGFESGPQGAHIEVDFTQWDPWLEKYVDGLGFQSFRLPISYMPRRDAPGRVGSYEQGSEAYDRIVGDYLHTLQEHLREKGWLDVAYAYWVDEPAPEHYENVRYGMRLLDEYAPDIRRMLTEQPEPDLVGFVDIWCPVLHNYAEEAARERQAAGDVMWWYVCTGPKAPFAGLFTDHNAVDLRIWQWMSWKYDVTGSLIWATNYWYSPQRTRETGEYQNPWDDPMSYRSGGGGWWGNGDGRFIYPPKVDPNSEHEPIVTGPVDSVRWEMLREGLEDYEYFATLSRLAGDDAAAAALLRIEPEIIESPREFTRDPQPLYARRAAIAEAIERLGE